MKVKAILRRRPGRGVRRPGSRVPAAGLGSSGRRRSVFRSYVVPLPPRAAGELRELTGPPRPQPGRERQAALGAAAGPSARPGASTPPSARNRAGSSSRRWSPGPGAALIWGSGPEVPNRESAGKARAPELRPGARAAEPPRPGPQRAGFGTPLSGDAAPEVGRLGLGQERGGRATKVRSVCSWVV